MSLPEWATRVLRAARHDLATGDELAYVFRTLRELGEAVRELSEALRELHDEHNGPPLVRLSKKWEKAIAAAGRALAMYEDGPEVDEP